MPRHNGHSSRSGLQSRHSGDSIEHLLTRETVTGDLTPVSALRLSRYQRYREQRRRQEAAQYIGRWILKGDALRAITTARERLVATVRSFVSAKGLPGFVYIAEHQLVSPGTPGPFRNGNVRPANSLESVRAALVRAHPTAKKEVTVYGHPYMFIRRGGTNSSKRVALALNLTADREATLPPEPLGTEAAFARTRYAVDILLKQGEAASPSHTIILIGTAAFHEDGIPPLADLLPPVLAVPLSLVSRGGGRVS